MDNSLSKDDVLYRITNSVDTFGTVLVGILIIVIITVAWLLIRAHKKNKRQQEERSAQVEINSQATTPVYGKPGINPVDSKIRIDDEQFSRLVPGETTELTLHKSYEALLKPETTVSLHDEVDFGAIVNVEVISSRIENDQLRVTVKTI